MCNLNVSVPWMMTLKVKKLSLNNVSADLSINSELATHPRIFVPIKQTDNNNVKVF
jgi:hypothetical protein